MVKFSHIYISFQFICFRIFNKFYMNHRVWKQKSFQTQNTHYIRLYLWMIQNAVVMESSKKKPIFLVVFRLNNPKLWFFQKEQANDVITA